MPRPHSHKTQHYIPSSYLAAWCDPDTPVRMQPYVWTFNPTGGLGRKRAPGNLFTETDIYTIWKPDGSRDLRLEYGLSKVEKGLKRLVIDYVAKRRQLPQAQQQNLVAFVAAMHGRTPQAREIQRALWKKELDLGERQAQEQSGAVSDGKRAEHASSLPPDSLVELGLLRKAFDSPMQFLLPGAIGDGLPMLSQMSMTMMCTDEPAFITSDSPVTWFDPTVPRDKFLTHKSSLSDEGIEVAMPLSPQHLILMHHPMTPEFKPVRYVSADPPTVAALNRRTAVYADKAIVSWRDGFDQRWRIFPRDF